eukprot:scaffold98309_cov17-Tisochrysis_lutea.AAC.1
MDVCPGMSARGCEPFGVGLYISLGGWARVWGWNDDTCGCVPRGAGVGGQEVVYVDVGVSVWVCGCMGAVQATHGWGGSVPPQTHIHCLCAQVAAFFENVDLNDPLALVTPAENTELPEVAGSTAQCAKAAKKSHQVQATSLWIAQMCVSCLPRVGLTASLASAEIWAHCVSCLCLDLGPLPSALATHFFATCACSSLP